MKIFDCFPFFNELDLLEIRLNELNEIVDYFVIVEGENTWQNNLKISHYLTNIDKFQKFKDKIILITVPASKFNNDAWHNERISWNSISEALVNNATDSDLIMISALDEIPSAESIKEISNNYTSPCSVKMHLFYYFLNTKFKFIERDFWPGTYITKFSELNISDIFKYIATNRWEVNSIGYGWHFSFLGNHQTVYEKVHSYSHSEFNHFTENHYKQRIETLSDPFNRDGEVRYEETIGLDKLPIYVQSNLTKYSKYIKK